MRQLRILSCSLGFALLAACGEVPPSVVPPVDTTPIIHPPNTTSVLPARDSARLTAPGGVDINVAIAEGMGSLTPIVETEGPFTATWAHSGRVYFPGVLRITATGPGSGSATVRFGSHSGRVKLAAEPLSATQLDFHRGGACVLAMDGAAWCWGGNASGQLGSVTTQQCNGGACQYGGRNGNLTPLRVDSSRQFTRIQTIGYPCRFTLEPNQDCGLTCALTAAGDVWCWGLKPKMIAGIRLKSLALRVVPYVLGDYGVLCGIGFDDSKAYCIMSGGAVSGTPMEVGDGKTFQSLSAGRYHTCGVDLSGAAYCWGDNGYGALGIGTAGNTVYPTPQPVVGTLKFSSIEVGNYTTCAREISGVIYCWGVSVSAVTGKCSATQPCQSSPTAVALSRTYTSFSRDEFTGVCGVTSAGAVECWSEFATTPAPAPVTVPLTTVSLGAPGTNYGALYPYTACGLSADNVVHCWNGTTAYTIGR
jgi:hypothetical protein